MPGIHQHISRRRVLQGIGAGTAIWAAPAVVTLRPIAFAGSPPPDGQCPDPCVGYMFGNGTRSGVAFTSAVDCDACVANEKARSFTIQFDTHTFVATSYVTVTCFNNPAFTPSPPPATLEFDTQDGTAKGTLDGDAGYTLEWRLEDHGAPSPSDAVRLVITRDSDNSTQLDVPLGPLSSGQNEARPSDDPSCS